ncbi:protein of unknown function [Taphrina deformans PYCC 5710]|uniref:RING-type E3 ubiquitin transferase n=1 Tax=Taphrina deformans (strain PYCC 5710 / ATCC 11124 / CBS 356.35 / IMI 108563 / JCM 9778 / NBRC 8474) TaxID=1097556 RepID=R4XDE7_TAPDE|nr:protein of unknown function [Taphrina deformans PYCC 5710]|eukprot:CCG83901.1 protein of unknown function [Taphrina deformans PYCC 5710]
MLRVNSLCAPGLILEGQIITSIIIVIFVVAFLIREWIVQNNAHLLDESPEFLGNVLIPPDEARRQAMRLEAIPPDVVADGAAEIALGMDIDTMMEDDDVEAPDQENLLATQTSQVTRDPPHAPESTAPHRRSEDSSDWENLKAQAAQNSRRAQMRTNNTSSELSAGAGVPEANADDKAQREPQEEATDHTVLTAAEQRAVRRQAILQAASQRLRANGLDNNDMPESSDSRRRRRVEDIDVRLASEGGARSSQDLRHERARRRSLERKMWEEADRSTAMEYPDSPIPVPKTSGLPGISDQSENLALDSQPVSTTVGPDPVTKLKDSMIEQDQCSTDAEKSEISENSDATAPVTTNIDGFGGREPGVVIADRQLEILLTQIRLAGSPAERTQAANAAIQVCIDLALAATTERPLDRLDPVYRETIRHVGTIARIANQHGVEGAVDVQRALRLTTEIPRPEQMHEPHVAAVAMEVDNPVPNDVRDLQAEVDNAEANAIARGDMDEDIDGLLMLIGVRGPILALLQNSMLVVVMVTSFIVFGVCLPHMCGRSVLAIIRDPWMYLLHLPVEIARTIIRQFDSIARITLRGAKMLFSPITNHSRVVKYTLLSVSAVGKKLQGLAALEDKWKSLGEAPSGLVSYLVQAGQRISANGSVERTPDLLEIFAKQPASVPERVLTVFSGYVTLISLGSLYIKLNLRMTTGEQGKNIELIVRSILRQAGFAIKFVSILSIELILFPFYCGILLDGIFSPFFLHSTFIERLSFFADYPFTSIFLHWLLGTIYMFNFALFVSMCREIVRPGLLFFIRDPNDPTFNPIKDILERPIRNQMRKIGISILIYGALILVASGAVVWALFRCLSGILPLSWNSAEPLFEVPFDLLLFQILLPLTYRYTKPHKLIKSVWSSWFTGCARALRLSSFIMGERHPDEEGYLEGRSSLLAQLWFKSPDVNAPSFKKSGSFRRVPAIDSLPMRQGRDMILVVTEDNNLHHPVEGDDETRDDPNYTVVYAPPKLRLRIHAFLFLMWAFAATLCLGVVVMPLLIGRRIFRTIASQSQAHDLIAYLYGVYAIGITIWFLRKLSRATSFKNSVVNCYRDVVNNPTQAMSKVSAGLVLTLKWSYLLGTMSVLIPVLLGLTLETYVIIPLGIWLNPAYVPTVHLVHDWIVGLVYVKIIGRTALMMPPNTVGDALNNTMRNDWRRGWRNPDLRLATRRLIFPITASLLAALIMPLSIGALAKHVAYNHVPKDNAIMLYRMSYPAAFLSAMLILAGRAVHSLLLRWRATVRDTLYLKGRKLHNFGESMPPALPASEDFAPVQQSLEQQGSIDLTDVREETTEILDNLVQMIEDEEEMASRAVELALRDERPFDASQTGAGLRAKVMLERARQSAQGDEEHAMVNTDEARQGPSQSLDTAHEQDS